MDKRIDVLATALHANMTVQDLEQLDLAYAPQFNSAKGPVIMAGFVAANTLRGEVQTITGEELQKKLAENTPLQLLDVRTPEEHEEAHVPQSRLVPVDETPRTISKTSTPPKKPSSIAAWGYVVIWRHAFSSNMASPTSPTSRGEY